jgi:hypothetical protein
MKQILRAMILALSLVVSSPFGHGQTAVEAWVQRHSEAGSLENLPRAIAVDSSGNAIVTGSSTDTNAFDLKHWVTIAYSSSGAPMWTNRYHGPDFYDDQPNAVAVDAAGNAFVTGVSFGGGSGQDYVTIKYSSAGVALWTNRYNGPGNGNDGANAVVVDGSGNVIVAGLSVGTIGLSSYFDYATIKYSGAGVPLWTNRYNGPANNEDQATDVAVAGSGNVFVTGYSFASDGRSDYLTIAYSSAGVPLWTNRYNGPVNDSDDYARAVAVDGNGNVFVTGDSWNGSVQEYATIAYSGAGAPLWTNRYHTPGSGNNFARAIAADSNGNVFVTGKAGGFATIKYSNAGMPLWTNRYNGPSGFSFDDTARAIAVDGGGNLIVTGDSYRDFVTRDIATIAYSNAGIPLWTNRYNGPANGDDVPLTKQSLALGPGGSVYVTAASDGDNSDETVFDFATVKYVISGPSLFITRSNASVILSWPVSALNFQLQENTDLSLSNGWSIVAAARSTNNGFISVTLPGGDGRRFFRLGSP